MTDEQIAQDQGQLAALRQINAELTKRLRVLKEAAQPFVNQWNGKGAATREHYKRLAEVLEGK